MMIVCPSCASSYMIDPTAIPAGGRTLRCARCKATWHADSPKSAANVSAFVDGVIAEAEAQSGDAPPRPMAWVPEPEPEPPADDFGDEPAETIAGTGAVPPAAVIDAGETVPAPPAEAAGLPATEALSLVPPIGHDQLGESEAAGTEGEDVESFAARRERLRARRKTKRRSSHWTAIILVLVAFNVAMIGARTEVVRYLPQTAPLFAAVGLPVNLRNLKFENVRISKDTEKGIGTLVVDGTIVSTGNSATKVPRLRFSVRNASGQEIYNWTGEPARSVLEPDEKLDFHSRLASLPADAADVLVRFFTAQDAAAGLK